jgi:hypothetical protein
MALDTSRTIEIESSPLKLLVLVGIGVLMTAGGAVLAFGGLSGRGDTLYAHVVGYVALVFFAACTVVALWRLFTARGPVITISPQGIRDTRVAADVIPWNAITGISTWEFKRQKAMILAVVPAVEAKLALTRMARWTRGANRALEADGLAIVSQGLKIDHDTLLATCKAYAQAALGVAAGQARAT